MLQFDVMTVHQRAMARETATPQLGVFLPVGLGGTIKGVIIVMDHARVETMDESSVPRFVGMWQSLRKDMGTLVVVTRPHRGHRAMGTHHRIPVTVCKHMHASGSVRMRQGSQATLTVKATTPPSQTPKSVWQHRIAPRTVPSALLSDDLLAAIDVLSNVCPAAVAPTSPSFATRSAACPSRRLILTQKCPLIGVRPECRRVPRRTGAPSADRYDPCLNGAAALGIPTRVHVAYMLQACLQFGHEPG